MSDAFKIEKGKTYRPEDLANALGISGKIVRSYLRSTYTRPVEQKGSTWTLDSDVARATFDHFIARRTVAPVTVADAAE